MMVAVDRRLSWRGLKAVLPAAVEGRAAARKRRLRRFIVKQKVMLRGELT